MVGECSAFSSAARSLNGIRTQFGSHVPVGAVLAQKQIFNKVFNRMDPAVAHGSTFGGNDLAMAAGIAALDVLASERLIENAGRTGQQLLQGLTAADRTMRRWMEGVRRVASTKRSASEPALPEAPCPICFPCKIGHEVKESIRLV
jgi:Aminotransferase class-III